MRAATSGLAWLVAHSAVPLQGPALSACAPYESRAFCTFVVRKGLCSEAKEASLLGVHMAVFLLFLLVVVLASLKERST